MTVLKIYEYPDEILRQPGEVVVDFGEQFQQHIDNLIETMYASPGSIGLSATQAGIPLRVFLMDLNPQTPESDLKVYVNPVIVRSSRWKMAREGCMSFPEYLATVKRAKRLTVTGCDRYGTPFERDIEGFEAVVIQHELDHLDGILMIDRIRSISKDWRLRDPKPAT